MSSPIGNFTKTSLYGLWCRLNAANVDADTIDAIIQAARALIECEPSEVGGALHGPWYLKRTSDIGVYRPPCLSPTTQFPFGSPAQKPT